MAVILTALLFGAQIQRAAAGEFVPLKLRGTVMITSIVPISIDGDVLTAAIEAADSGWGTHFGYYSSEFHLVVEIDLGTGLPLRGGGIVVQSNADGSTVTWQNHFEGPQTGSIIVSGTGRFENAKGWVEGESVLNEDGTLSYDEAGQITSVGSKRRAKP